MLLNCGPPATAGGSDILVVGVGIEPTFRAFQTRANPPQLSDRIWSLAFGFWSLTKTKGLRPFFKLVLVHVHEQVLAPFGSRLCIVTKHDAFKLHTQRRLRSQ